MSTSHLNNLRMALIFADLHEINLRPLRLNIHHKHPRLSGYQALYRSVVGEEICLLQDHQEHNYLGHRPSGVPQHHSRRVQGGHLEDRVLDMVCSGAQRLDRVGGDETER